MTPQPTEAMIEAVALAIRDVTSGENYDYMDFCRDAAKAAIAALRSLDPSREVLEADKARLDYLQTESDDLRCFDIPTGGGDADIGWQVIGHFQGAPRERVIAEVWHDDVRAAIDAARAADKWKAPALSTLTDQEEQGK
jgi:hypothetical protein